MAKLRELADEFGYWPATTRPGDLASPDPRRHREFGPDFPFRQRKLKDSWRPGLATARAGPLPTWMKAMDLGNRAYRSSSLTVTVTRP